MAKKSAKNNKQDLPDIPENQREEYSEELADHDDREAQARAEAANRRVDKKNI